MDASTAKAEYDRKIIIQEDGEFNLINKLTLINSFSDLNKNFQNSFIQKIIDSSFKDTGEAIIKKNNNNQNSHNRYQSLNYDSIQLQFEKKDSKIKEKQLKGMTKKCFLNNKTLNSNLQSEFQGNRTKSTVLNIKKKNSQVMDQQVSFSSNNKPFEVVKNKSRTISQNQQNKIIKNSTSTLDIHEDKILEKIHSPGKKKKRKIIFKRQMIEDQNQEGHQNQAPFLKQKPFKNLLTVDLSSNKKLDVSLKENQAFKRNNTNQNKVNEEVQKNAKISVLQEKRPGFKALRLNLSKDIKKDIEVQQKRKKNENIASPYLINISKTPTELKTNLLFNQSKENSKLPQSALIKPQSNMQNQLFPSIFPIKESLDSAKLKHRRLSCNFEPQSCQLKPINYFESQHLLTNECNNGDKSQFKRNSGRKVTCLSSTINESQMFLLKSQEELWEQNKKVEILIRTPQLQKKTVQDRIQGIIRNSKRKEEFEKNLAKVSYSLQFKERKFRKIN